MVIDYFDISTFLSIHVTTMLKSLEVFFQISSIICFINDNLDSTFSLSIIIVIPNHHALFLNKDFLSILLLYSILTSMRIFHNVSSRKFLVLVFSIIFRRIRLQTFSPLSIVRVSVRST